MLKGLFSRAPRALVTTLAIGLAASLLAPGHAIARSNKGIGGCKRTNTCNTSATDTTPPSVAIGLPAAGSSVSGSITVSGTASDNLSIASVAIAVDSGSYASAAGTTTWSTTLNTTNYADGSHTLRARATDSSGNVTLVSETITTSNTIPTSSPSPSPSPSPSSTLSSSTFSIPTSIDDTGATDVAPAILSWIAAVPDGSTLVFGAGKTYRVEEVLQITGRKNLTFDGKGSTFISKNAAEDQRAMWRTWDCSILVFKNMTLTGSYSTPGTFNSSLQHAHGLDLRGTSAEIYGVHILNMAGDGVYFGLGQTSALNKSSGSFHDSSVVGTGRNGVSVTAGQNIMVQKITTDKVGYETFDVEPNVGTGWGASNVTFESNTLGSSYEQSFVVIGNAPISNITFSNNSGTLGLVAYVVGRTYRPSNVVFSGNITKNSMNAPVFDISYADYPAVTNNTVPIWSGSLITFNNDCKPTDSGNSYPGGSSEATITNPVAC
jgi:Big-like domain-containing protein